MNVLFLTFTYPTPESPAGGIFVKEHARAAARNANVAVVHLDRGGGWYAVEDVDDEEFPTVRVRYPRTKLAYPLHFIGAIAATRRLRRRGFAPDVIHAHVFLAALPPILLRPFFRRPVVVTEHWSVFLPEDPASLSAPMLWTARAALARAAFVLPVSAALQRGMEMQGIRARFRVVPNAVDVSLFAPSERNPDNDDRHLLFVGLLYPAKGVDTLLDALALARNRRDGLHLEIVGDGPERAAYERRAADLGLDGIVQFAGRVPKHDVAERMRAADLFVLTSRFETAGCALIEAQATGLPAVVTRVGGIPEILGDRGGLLAEPEDPESIATRIVEALDAAHAFDSAAIAQRARERYSMEAVGEQLRDVYDLASR